MTAQRSVRSLADVVHLLAPYAVRGSVPATPIAGIAADSRQIGAGDLFVAVRGVQTDGHDYLANAAANGAVAAVVQRDPPEPVQLPLIRVADSRKALAELAAAWHGYPAREIPLVGITGTMGKTSMLSFLEAILNAAEVPVGSVGSLGVRCGGRTLEDTGHTVPGPLVLHRVLRELRDRGCEKLLMEATTHALTQDRLHGVEYQLGVFTCLVPLEHLEYHDSFQSYVDAKLRYFEHLRPGAPLIYFADDPVLQAQVGRHDVQLVPCGTGPDAAVRMEIPEMGADGTTLRLSAPGGVPRLDGGHSEPLDLELRLPLRGRSTAVNAMLSAVTAAALGATPAAIHAALSSLTPVTRRMQIVQSEPFLILDDFGGHPNTVSAVFELIGSLEFRRLHVLTGYRGSRGVAINRAMAGALAASAKGYSPATFCVTAAEETSNERNWAEPEEREVFKEALRLGEAVFTEEDRLDSAARRIAERIEEGDLLLILGTQGMDGAADLVRRLRAGR